MPDMSPTPKSRAGKMCLALDLDETLVHSSFSPVSNADYVIPVTIEDVVHNVFVIKRPGVDQFMKKVGEHFEVKYCFSRLTLTLINYNRHNYEIINLSLICFIHCRL